jgi:hypothetical protein
MKWQMTRLDRRLWGEKQVEASVQTTVADMPPEQREAMVQDILKRLGLKEQRAKKSRIIDVTPKPEPAQWARRRRVRFADDRFPRLQYLPWETGAYRRRAAGSNGGESSYPNRECSPGAAAHGAGHPRPRTPPGNPNCAQLSGTPMMRKLPGGSLPVSARPATRQCRATTGPSDGRGIENAQARPPTGTRQASARDIYPKAGPQGEMPLPAPGAAGREESRCPAWNPCAGSGRNLPSGFRSYRRDTVTPLFPTVMPGAGFIDCTGFLAGCDPKRTPQTVASPPRHRGSGFRVRVRERSHFP